MTQLEKLPVGTAVNYHGSLESFHGEYTVDGYSDLTREYYAQPEIVEQYPHGFAYDLWPVGVSKKFGNRSQALYYVRPENVNPVEKTDGTDGHA